ncbi:hypothetical protein H4R34_000827 [Dimargaris verticillata]|uniref:Prefoldin subunit 3 n=1 Tax=Dimargaris verticillata TaxID=2761393 RepID=A0A9W8B5J3_9FUNG|nr:hypothetical protein H4R34_000827 [Dimargaris verticillata]
MDNNPRGIPKAPFIDDVEAYVSKNESVEVSLKKFSETLSKYRFMENNMLQRRKTLESKIPEIEKTLAMVDFLIAKQVISEVGFEGLGLKFYHIVYTLQDSDEPIRTRFELHDTCYARADIETTDRVYLWLGANVMLEYPLDDAKTLLQEKLEKAQTSLNHSKEDAEFLREQITTMEVNTARFYNWDVKKRQETRVANEEDAA